MYNDIPLMGRTWMIGGSYWMLLACPAKQRVFCDKTKQTGILLKCFTQQESTMFSFTGILGQFSLWLSTGRLSYDPSDETLIFLMWDSLELLGRQVTQKMVLKRGPFDPEKPCPFQTEIQTCPQWSRTSGQVLERSSAWLVFLVMAVMAVWSLLAFLSMRWDDTTSHDTIGMIMKIFGRYPAPMLKGKWVVPCANCVVIGLTWCN